MASTIAIYNQTAFAEEKYQINALRLAVGNGSDNWNVYYQLAVYSAYNKDFVTAEKLCIKSMAYDNNYLNNHLMAFILNNIEGKNSLYFARKCITLERGNYSLAESVMRLFLDKAEYESVMQIYDMLSDKLKDEHRLKMYLAMSHLKLGNATLAESLLMDNGGLCITDYREGERLLDKLYRGIRSDKYAEKYDEVIVPIQFDFLGIDQ